MCSITAVEDIDTATARGVHGCTGQTHGPRVGGTQKTLPPEETAHPAGYGHQEEATVSQLIIIIHFTWLHMYQLTPSPTPS